jgi:hypothetical protein
MSRVHVLGFVLATALVSFLAWSMLAPAAAQDNKALQPTQKWEYKVINVTGVAIPAMEEVLNRVGAEGWELCTTPQPDRTARGTDVVIFKRPRR